MTGPRRRAVFAAALAFATIEPQTSELRFLHRWLDSWRGIGDIVAGMARQGFDIQLTRYDARGWRATFFVTGIEHSATSATGSAFEATPWTAAQRAAWVALAAMSSSWRRLAAEGAVAALGDWRRSHSMT